MRPEHNNNYVKPVWFSSSWNIVIASRLSAHTPRMNAFFIFSSYFSRSLWRLATSFLEAFKDLFSYDKTNKVGHWYRYDPANGGRILFSSSPLTSLIFPSYSSVSCKQTSCAFFWQAFSTFSFHFASTVDRHACQAFNDIALSLCFLARCVVKFCEKRLIVQMRTSPRLHPQQMSLGI